ncbi:melanoma receptor tyrosine-protein kinase-like [Betta splendens]|uniref:Receptor protein-tyrosine kinase n=1 Tax=Betta splendens TaxID=158456 RepID=A0A6P7M5U6_BETSP|nr:melanoma receptor tyrosine-protein kinase-like [Betta splendens]
MKFLSGGAAALMLLLLGRCCCTSPDRKVCQGMSNQLTLLGTRENHYDNMVKMYSHCSVVLENLEVTYTLEHQDLSFLQSIEEVGGHVLIAMNEAATIPLVNLRLIRGQILYEGHYSLLVISNYNRNSSSATLNYTSGLRQLQLSNLTEILKGGVKISHNPLLCNIDSIQWWDILDNASDPKILYRPDSFPHKCDRCDPACDHGSCWAAGPDHCQKLTKLPCASQCSRRCLGPKPSDCCNQHCAAGCTGPQDTDCLACRDFNDNGTCKDMCPPLEIYDQKTYEVVENPDAKFTFGSTCVKACPHNYVVTGGSCVRTCGSQMYEVEEKGVQRCRACDGPCPKACNGIGVGTLINTLAVNTSNIESFRNCTKINGDLYFLATSFTGDAHYKVPPMDPSKLEYFRTVREITGFLLIQAWPQNMSSLSVFENLEIIRGRTTRSGFSLVVVKAEHLRWLGLRSLKEISAGKVMLRDNTQLCYNRPEQWTHLFKSSLQSMSAFNNAPPETCEQQNQTCDSECTADGCWGPGPGMCVACAHATRRGSCVASCIQGEVEVNSSCVECHPQCLQREGSPPCHGPGPDHCYQCANFKDGPHCVLHCPQGVVGDGNALIWKYPDQTGQCQTCHQNCKQGCFGPGPSKCKGDSNPPTLAASVVGGLLVAVVLAVLVSVLIRRRRIKRRRTVRRLLQERELVEPLAPSGQAPNQVLLRVLKESEFKKIRVLGSGAFGTVFKGMWTPEGEDVKIPVAIKVLREATLPKANQEILNEAYVMASVEHPHVCRLLGVCLTSSVQLVTQLMPFGCLLDYVRHHRENIGAQWLLNWCVQIAKGMNYLEEHHLVHRDLAARNVLVKNPNHVKITDFGLAKLLTTDEKEYHSDGGKVPIKWMALESILQWTYTHQSDVWSYGVTVWELMTFGSKPYDSIPASEIASVLEKGERLPQPPICTIDVYMIMVKCWMIDPSSRIRFKELVAEFSRMARDPSRYLVIQGNLPSPSDSRFYSRLLSSDDMDEVVDAEEYLLPYKGRGNHELRPCNAANGQPATENNVSLRYITDPTHNMLEKQLGAHEYMNQSLSETSRSRRLSEVLNPNYEDLSQGWGAASLPSPPVKLRPRGQAPEGPEYMNTAHSWLPAAAGGCLHNPDYQAEAPGRASGADVFLPAAENLEYLGVGPLLYNPGR